MKHIKKVIVASENPVKINVAKRAFSSLYPGEEFEFVAVKSQSGVPEQPMNTETETGAHNRLAFIQDVYPEADFWISQEGGLYEDVNRLYNQAWIAIADKEGYVAKTATAQFHLPNKLAEVVRSGLELGHASDAFFNTSNSKQGMSTIGHLTDGLLDRENYYLQAAIIALSELKHKEWY
jgi:inosine/xanthosine triphosphatase